MTRTQSRTIKSRQRPRAFLVAGVMLAVCGLCSSSAQAAPVTVGQLFTPLTSCSGAATVLQTGVADGDSYAVPVSGVIVSWSFRDGPTTVAGSS